MTETPEPEAPIRVDFDQKTGRLHITRIVSHEEIDRADGLLEVRDGVPISVLEDLEVGADRSGRGVGQFLLRRFAQESAAHDAHLLHVYFASPTSVRLAGKVFGEENVTILEQHEGQTIVVPMTTDQAAETLKYQDEVLDRHAEAGTDMPTHINPNIHAVIDLTSPAVTSRLDLPDSEGTKQLADV